jgi:shikimate kinase
MGSGKSTVGRVVAHRVGATFCDLDSMIESDSGVAIAEMFAIRGESAFRTIESRLLPAALEPGAVVALGGGTPMDESNWKLITERAMTVFLDVPFETIWRRVGGAATRPLATSRSRAELEALLDERRPRYQEASHRIDADRPIDMVAGEVMKLWSA